MKIYNSLSKKVENFKPIEEGKVKMYTCGPTVYDYASIGNFRSYTVSDLLVRALKYEGYEVSYVMNLTDVGHLTGDNDGDADTGEDRMEKGAKREGKTAWVIAQFYIDAFLRDYKKLNLTEPKIFTRATEHIDEQINLVRELEKNGFTYKTSDGIYFDTKAFEEKTGKKYGELSDLDEIKEGARVQAHPEKKNARDFALWKLSPLRQGFEGQAGKRQMEWESPWGLGFPGWHIECSAMSMKYLGNHFDIHAGGEDLKQTHHPNEVAQSEGATGETFVNYWVHVAFLKVDGKRMGKSLGNAYTVDNIEEKRIDPLALRYFYLSGHYREVLNFTWEALESSENALKKLRDFVAANKNKTDRNMLSKEKDEKVNEFRDEFRGYVMDDLKMPQALAIVWKAIKSNIPTPDKVDLLYSFDEVLGLGLREFEFSVPSEIKDLLAKREDAKKNKNFAESDKLREEIESKGFRVEDTVDGARVKPA